LGREQQPLVALDQCDEEAAVERPRQIDFVVAAHVFVRHKRKRHRLVHEPLDDRARQPRDIFAPEQAERLRTHAEVRQHTCSCLWATSRGKGEGISERSGGSANGTAHVPCGDAAQCAEAQLLVEEMIGSQSEWAKMPTCHSEGG
jgi:hypothetical protein